MCQSGASIRHRSSGAPIRSPMAASIRYFHLMLPSGASMHGQPTRLHLRAGNRSTPKGCSIHVHEKRRPMGQSHAARLALISIACLMSRSRCSALSRLQPARFGLSAWTPYRGGVGQRNGQPWRPRPLKTLKSTSPTNEPRHRPGADFPPGASASEPETDPTNSAGAGTEIFAMQMWLYYVASRDRNRGSLRGGSCSSYFSLYFFSVACDALDYRFSLSLSTQDEGGEDGCASAKGVQNRYVLLLQGTLPRYTAAPGLGLG